MSFHTFELENRTIVTDIGSCIFFNIVESQLKLYIIYSILLRYEEIPIKNSMNTQRKVN